MVREIRGWMSEILGSNHRQVALTRKKVKKMNKQRKTILVITLSLILAFSTILVLAYAKPSELPRGLEKGIPKNGFIVKTDFGNVIRYREYIPLDLSPDIPYEVFYSVNVYAYEYDGSIIVIDAGHELLANKLYACLVSDFGKKPITVLLTHGHVDHAGGGSYLIGKGAEVYVQVEDFETVYNGYESPMAPDAFKYTGYIAQPYPIVYDPLPLPLPFYGSTILYTPGHTPGSVSIYRSDGSLFTGDLTLTLGESESPIDFTSAIIYNTLQSHAEYPYSEQILGAQLLSLLTLPQANKLYPGHFGPYTGDDIDSVIDETVGEIYDLLSSLP